MITDSLSFALHCDIQQSDSLKLLFYESFGDGITVLATLLRMQFPTPWNYSLKIIILPGGNAD